MALTYSSWSINSAPADVGGSGRLKLNRLTMGYGRFSELEFAEGPGASPVPSIALNSPVALTLDKEGTSKPAFRGRVHRVAPSRSRLGWTHHYLCQGLEWDADQVPIQPANGGTRYVFNAPQDSEEHAASLSGKTIGQICRIVLDDHESALDDLGIGIGSVAEFETALTHTHAEPIRVGGESLWAWLTEFVGHWAPNHRVFLEYDAEGAEIRLADLTAPATVRTLTLGEDEIEPPSFSIDTSQCFTRVVILGDDEVEPYELKLSAGQAEKHWTSGEESAWKLTDFTEQETAKIAFSVVSMTESTVTIDPTSADAAWASNYWVADERQGQLHLEKTTGSGGSTVTFQQDRPVASNAALTAGGTCAITVDRPFSTDDFTNGHIRGRKLVREHVWRRYRPSDPDVRSNLRRVFPTDVVYRFAGGSAALTGIRAPMGFIVVGSTPYQIIMEIDQGTGDCWFNMPVVAHAALDNDPDDLNDGTVEHEPDDVILFVPVSQGRLRVPYPPDDESGNPVFEGLGLDWHGIERTKYVYIPQWRDPNAKSQLQAMAEQLHRSFADPILAAALTIHGFAAHDWFPMNQGVTLSAKEGPGGPTLSLGRLGDATLAVQAVTLDWGGRDGLTTTLAVSNERRPSAAMELYQLGIAGRALR